MDTFSDKNPAMEFCDAVYFLAYMNGKIVGRVAGIINRRANERWEQRMVRFGYIDFIDDKAVSKALIDAVQLIYNEFRLFSGFVCLLSENGVRMITEILSIAVDLILIKKIVSDFPSKHLFPVLQSFLVSPHLPLHRTDL